MNTPELTLEKSLSIVLEKLHNIPNFKDYQEAKNIVLNVQEGLRDLSLARLQIESQGVTGKPRGSSSTLPTSSGADGADAPPFEHDHSENKHRYVWWSWHPAYPQWSQSCWGADAIREAILDLHRPLACKMRLYHNKLVRRDGNEHTVVYDLTPNEDLDPWHFKVDSIFLDARKAANQSPPIHTEESPSDSELLTWLFRRGHTQFVNRSAIKAAMEQEKQ
jgi:hypothetical protein